jgi:hypothetical protein
MERFAKAVPQAELTRRVSPLHAPFRAVGVRFALLLFFCTAATFLNAREKDTSQYGAGLIVNVPLPEAEVAQVVQDVAQNGIIRGTKEYNKDEFIQGAITATSAKGFSAPTEAGKIFYKVREHAIDPRNFKDGSDVGSLSVRYILQAQGDRNTVLRIDAVFVEDFRHTVHQSNGSVESAEYKDIHDRLDAIELMKTQTTEAERERQEMLTKKEEQKIALENAPDRAVTTSADEPGAAQPASAAPSPAEQPSVHESMPRSDAGDATAAMPLEDRVKELRRQVERLVKSPGAALKSAPFHTASTLESLTPGTEVMIVISTPYWVGVETHEGQHGWILRDELEQAP